MQHFLSLLLAGFLVSVVANCVGADSTDVWIGTADAAGIYRLSFDTHSGTLGAPTLAAEIRSPGFLASHPDGKTIYAVGQVDGQPSVAAFRVTQHEHGSQLTPLNSQPIGSGAAHVSVDRSGAAVFTAQYGEGTVAVFPLQADGALLPKSQQVAHAGGSKVVTERQDRPHPHWTGTSPDNRFLFVPDLGLDQVVIYQLSTAPLMLTKHSSAAMPAGSGPRHMKFHPNGKWAYVLNELSLTVSACSYDQNSGKLAVIDTVQTLSDDVKAGEQFNSASEIRVHPSGLFVYTANRGNDTISGFAVNDDGRLTPIQTQPVRGAWPRNFAIDPSGKWLLAAGRDSNTLSVFQIDAASGKLTYVTHGTASVPSPICVMFVK